MVAVSVAETWNKPPLLMDGGEGTFEKDVREYAVCLSCPIVF